MKEWIKQIGTMLGVDIRSAQHNFMNRIVRHLNNVNCEMMLDVGANVGQFASATFDAGYTGKIISFEPLIVAREKLIEHANRRSSQWIIAQDYALSDCTGTVRFNVAANLASSSMYEQSVQFSELASFAQKTHEVEVKTVLLDDVLDTLIAKNTPFSIKIDTQGAELRVLKGAVNNFHRIQCIILEQSIASLYESQPSYHETDNFLRASGFRLVDLEPGFRNTKNSHLLEFDAVYVNVNFS